MPQPLVPIPFTAVVPAAGLGTRFLPATKTVPKELLPVVDTPGIELVAAEAAEAGAERLVIITSEGKDGLLPDEDAIAVLLPDDLVLPTGVLETMSKVRAKRGGTVLCAIEVPADKISAYGVFDVEVVPDAANPNVLKVNGMVEKPKAEDAPSLYAAAGRYVLD